MTIEQAYNDIKEIEKQTTKKIKELIDKKEQLTKEQRQTELELERYKGRYDVIEDIQIALEYYTEIGTATWKQVKDKIQEATETKEEKKEENNR